MNPYTSSLLESSRFVFLLPNATNREITSFLEADISKNWQLFNSGRNAWVLQTFYYLRPLLPNVFLSNRMMPDAINLVHGAESRCMTWAPDTFVINLRADYPPNKRANAEIVQNAFQSGPRKWYVTHWPQPGLIPRDVSRGLKIETIGYFGRGTNHYSRWLRRASGWDRVKDVINDVAQILGLKLVVKSESQWNDYSDVDVAIGIRSFGSGKYSTKPPTKLINAAYAGVIFFGGADSAFGHVGQPDINYVRIVSKSELKSKLATILNTEYNEVLFRGARILANRYSLETIKNEWLAVLTACAMIKRQV
jgi:hypothetical protein